MLQLTRQMQGRNNHVVMAVGRLLSAADVAPHGDIQQHGHVSHGARPLGDGRLHDGPAINVPQHPTLAGPPPGLLPGEVVAHRPGMHVVYLGPPHAVLVLVVMLAPVETAPVLAVAVPRLGDVDLAVRRPAKGLLREQPEGGPDALGAGGQDDGRENALITGKSGPAHETSRRVALLFVLRGIVCQGADDELAVRGAADVSLIVP